MYARNSFSMSYGIGTYILRSYRCILMVLHVFMFVYVRICMLLFVLVDLYVFKCLSQFTSVCSTEHMFFEWVYHTITPICPCVRKVEIGRWIYQQQARNAHQNTNREILCVCVCVCVYGLPQWRKRTEIPEIKDNKCAESHFWCAHTYRNCVKNPGEYGNLLALRRNRKYFRISFLNNTVLSEYDMNSVRVNVCARIQHKYILIILRIINTNSMNSI